MLVLVIIPASLQTSGIFFYNILSNPFKAMKQVKFESQLRLYEVLQKKT
jgi:hypothetical protein